MEPSRDKMMEHSLLESVQAVFVPDQPFRWMMNKIKKSIYLDAWPFYVGNSSTSKPRPKTSTYAERREAVRRSAWGRSVFDVFIALIGPRMSGRMARWLFRPALAKYIRPLGIGSVSSFIFHTYVVL